jgi:hypothetical protein
LISRGGQRFSNEQAGLHADTSILEWPAFVSPAERAVAEQEWSALLRIDSGPNELGRRVLDWAKRNPTDPRVPEALHRVVRATRYGCTNERTGAISKAAFDLLHSRYPKSSWTAKTPHWFK